MMARQNLPPDSGTPTVRPPRPASSPRGTDQAQPESVPAGDDLFPGLGEFLRRAALGLFALLFVTRAYFPSEDAETGSGLVWVLLLLGASGLAVAANLVAGVTRVRWSWVDLAVFALMVLVGWSAGHAADRRSAITMAWEWGGMGLVYFLARNLPRTRAESAALITVVVATGVAVAGYGLYQAAFEFPQIRAQFLANPAAALDQLGIAAGTPAAESFRQRLLYSNEPFSTFALSNSLAGFILGPLVILFALGLDGLRRERPGSRWLGLPMVILPALILLVCLLLTKSRSAYLGLLVALVVLTWNYRAVVPRRWLIGVGVGVLVLLLGLTAAGVAARQLDVQILSEARKSLGYRWEYWVGTWGIITDAPPPFAASLASDGLMSADPALTTRSTRPFWWGVGPANFAGPYLRHKLPEASEEIQDPHNAVLEVWAESGVFAMLVLVLVLVLGTWQVLGRGRPSQPVELDLEFAQHKSKRESPGPRPTTWLLVLGGLGWFGVWVLGGLNPVTQPDMLMRWLVLGASWLLGAILIGPIVSRSSVPSVGLGAAVVALAINLQAAGGIGIPSVAMALWVLLALGLNLRDDQPSGRIRSLRGLGLGVILACGWAVLAGTFYGAVVPGWQSDQAVAEGERLMRAQPPRYEVARKAFEAAIELDRTSIRPWLALADLEYRFWRSPESGERYKTAWTRILLTFDKALEGSHRDPDNLSLRRRQANFARTILRDLPDDAKPFELLGLKTTIAKATRHAVRLYPTSATLRAELARASADLGRYGDAAAEAKAALELDALTPHADKRLPANLRQYLRAEVVAWRSQAAAPVPTPLGR